MSSLTINTDLNDDQTTSKNLLWGIQSTPTGKSGRTWLQSPRKWSGKTPTNKDDGLSPSSSRTNTYSVDKMFGKEEDVSKNDESSEEKSDILKTLVYQSDRNGQPVNQVAKRGSNEMNIEANTGKDRESRSSTVWGLFMKGKIWGNEEIQGQESSTIQNKGNTTPRTRGTETTPRSSTSDDTSSTTSISTKTNRRSLKTNLRINGINSKGKDSTDTTPRTGRTTPRTGRNSDTVSSRSVSPRVLSLRSMKTGLLGESSKADRGKKCLILDLDETLVHSSFKPVDCADFIIPVSIEGSVTHVYVTKRPGVDNFMQRIGELYEVVIFTASLPQYADPLLDILDIHQVIKHRLFRSDCTFHNGSYVKDLSKIDRPIDQTIIVDNSPLSFMFQPQNAIGCTSFFDDPTDTELKVIGDFLVDIVDVEDVRDHCRYWETGCKNKHAITNSPRSRIPTGA